MSQEDDGRMMRHDPEKRHRRSIRLRRWDYRNPGAYFTTIWGAEAPLLSAKAKLSHSKMGGEIARDEWLASPDIQGEIQLDTFVVMPNHIHGIIVIVTHPSGVGATHCVAPTNGHVSPRGPAPGSLGAIVGAFKSHTAREINRLRDTPGAPVWQRNYYERIIRNEREWDAIRRYIRDNPARWAEDRENLGG